MNGICIYIYIYIYRVKNALEQKEKQKKRGRRRVVEWPHLTFFFSLFLIFDVAFFFFLNHH